MAYCTGNFKPPRIIQHQESVTKPEKTKPSKKGKTSSSTKPKVREMGASLKVKPSTLEVGFLEESTGKGPRSGSKVSRTEEKVKATGRKGSSRVPPEATNTSQSVVALTTAKGETSTGATSNAEAPITFSFPTKDSYNYFMPCVQVEQEKDDDDMTVTDIHIRGWKLTAAMMEVLNRCLPRVRLLRTLHLWRVGLETDTFSRLTAFMPRCSRLTTLILDSNPLTDYNVSCLLAGGSRLQHLSLRFCGLTDIEAAPLGKHLSTLTLPLVSLALSYNRIGDLGVEGIAEGLRLNRNLLTLNLASNRFGDEGVCKLAVALHEFPLNQEQMVERRRLLFKKAEKEARTGPLTRDPCSQIVIKPRSHSIIREFKEKKLGETVKRSAKEEFQILVDAKNKGKAWHLRHGAKTGTKDSLDDQRVEPLKTTSTSRRSGSVEEREKHEKRPTRRRKTTERTINPIFGRKEESINWMPDPAIILELTKPKEDFDLSPLTVNGRLHEGELWIRGNRTLTSLNLSRNKVGEKGLQALAGALRFQARNPMQERDVKGRGLRRLELQNIAAASNCQAFGEIRRLLAPRDPLLRCPRIDLEKRYISPCAVPIALCWP